MLLFFLEGEMYGCSWCELHVATSNGAFFVVVAYLLERKMGGMLMLILLTAMEKLHWCSWGKLQKHVEKVYAARKKNLKKKTNAATLPKS